MPETHYIEIDEEIIGAVSRLRKSSSVENVFVFPKRALILQSIINLKLLAREAEKLGKSIIVMSQDEQGMRLAEKAGLRVEEYHDSVLREHRQESDARFTVRHGDGIPMPEKPVNDGLRRSNEIGSSSFYTNEPVTTPRPVSVLPSAINTDERPVAAVEPRTLRVRNMSPTPLTTLNSVRDQSIAPVSPSQAAPLSMPVPQVIPPRPQPQNMTGGPMDRTDVRKEKLRRLFQQPESAGGTSIATLRPTQAPSSEFKQKESVRRTEPRSGGKSWFWAATSICIVVGVVLGGYFFLRPEAVVYVEPQAATQMVKRSLVGMVSTEVGENNTVPARVIEMEKTVRLSRPATGTDLGNAAKASGLITITNNQGESSQPLVATTRFETPDGKIFRLVEGVTVPGMKEENGKKVAGKIDARVMADASGSSYNLTSGTFRIPGFKGGPKYDTITAEVKSAFTGGGDGSGNGSLSVSASDLETAKSTAMDEAKQLVFADARSGLQSGEIVLEKSFQVALVGTPNAPATGTVVTSAFDYEARFQVRGFVLSENKVRSILDAESLESAGVVLKPESYEVGYGTVLSNFESKRLDFTVESKVLFQAPLDKDSLKGKLLGLDEAGIRTFLADHPEIKRLQVEFKPKVFIATIPDDPDRVSVQYYSDSTE